MVYSIKKRIFFWGTISLLFLLSGGHLFARFVTNSASEIIINEFLAANKTGITDEDGDHSDWIEIYNRSNYPVNLSGWSLTDNPTQPQKWPFPNITLGSHDYLVIFASGKNRKEVAPGAFLHTNFKLSKNAPYLALYNILDNRYVDVISPENTGQFSDISYGHDQGRVIYTYLNPTPGQPNDIPFISTDMVVPAVFNPAIAPAAPYDEFMIPEQIRNEVTPSGIEPQRGLQITEIMYHPLGGDEYEFIELRNVSAGQINLANAFFEGIDFTFPYDTPPLAPDEFVVLAANGAAFAERYPDVTLDGVYSEQLSNKGERISLKDATGRLLVSVEYDDENGWPISPDGLGDSLELVNLNGNPNNPKNWRASILLNGSPGADRAVPLAHHFNH